MTLYRHCPPEDDLIPVYLERANGGCLWMEGPIAPHRRAPEADR
jgi:hypothetical protein